MERGDHSLWIPGIPIPWSRARTNHGRYFTAPKVRGWMDVVKRHAMANGPDCVPIGGAVRLSMRFVLPMPESWSEKKKARMLGALHGVKPDLDNLSKCVLDALEEAGWFTVGDQQVASGEIEKVWGSECGVMVRVYSPVSAAS